MGTLLTYRTFNAIVYKLKKYFLRIDEKGTLLVKDH